jgi:hypothetical protein
VSSLLENCFLENDGQDFAGLAGFEFVHDEEAAGYMAFGLGAFAVCRGSSTYTAMEESAERTEALKPDFETNVSHAKLIAAEQLFCFLDAALDEVLMRSLVEGLPEETQKMIARETSLLRNLFETERMVVAVIDKVTRATEPL